MSNISFRITGGTDIGLERTNNEDNFILCSDLTKDDWFIPDNVDCAIDLSDAGCVFVVADGMGGMNAGEVASAIAVETVKELFTNENLLEISETANGIEDFLYKVVDEADSRIKAKQQEDESTSGMGTTIVIAWVVKDTAHLCWCGDSRAYLFNKASGLSRLSKDHSYVQELVDDGKLEPELAFDHPNSNIITRSLGDSRLSVNPDYISRRIVKGDCILLCSDGLCGLCRDEEIVEAFESEYSNIADLKSILMDKALSAGGYDNITLILFETVSCDSCDNQESIIDTINDFGAVIRKRRRSRIIKFMIRTLLLLALLAAACYFYRSRSFRNDEPVLNDGGDIVLEESSADTVGKTEGVPSAIYVQDTILETTADTLLKMNKEPESDTLQNIQE